MQHHSTRFLAIASTMGVGLTEGDIRRTTEIVWQLSGDVEARSERLRSTMRMWASWAGEYYGSGLPARRRRWPARPRSRGASLPSASVHIRGEPIPQTQVKLLPRKQRTPARIYETVVVPYYPTIEDRKWTWERLAERGWGRPKQEAVVDEGETKGFTMVFKHWGPGVDPLDPRNQERFAGERVIEGPGRALPPPTGTH